MRKLLLFCGSGVAAGMLAASLAGAAEPTTTTLNFAVMRNGDQIGTSALTLRRDGRQTTAQIATRIAVKIAYITVYRYEQNETEHWLDDKLVGLNSVTDDNGTVHKVSAKNRGNQLAVDADGKVTEVDAAMIPVSLWNASLVRRTMALNPQDGSVIPVSVVDHGKEQLVLQGRTTTAHHYSIKTNFPQDVWYDEHLHLLKVELRGSDGSKIQYQPG